MTHKRLVKKIFVLCALVCIVWFCEITDQAGPDTSQVSGASGTFEEIADKVGLKFQHYNGMTGKLFLPEIMGAGTALFDFDNDGDLDVFLVQGNSATAPVANSLLNTWPSGAETTVVIR